MGTQDGGQPVSETALALVEEQAEERIRRVWHEGRWYFSVVDVIGLLTDAPKPRMYWADMKRRILAEGFRELLAKCQQLKMTAPDGKQRVTDAADTETLLRIIQSVPSPKAEPVKQWLAKVGARRLEEVTAPLPAGSVAQEIATLREPAESAPALDWAVYYERLAALYRRQAAHEAQLARFSATLSEHGTHLGELHARVEGLEAGMRVLPEILERLGPETLTPENQRTVQNAVKRLHEAGGYAYASVYTELGQHFHVARYDQIAEAQWGEVMDWLRARIEAAEKRRGGEGTR